MRSKNPGKESTCQRRRSTSLAQVVDLIKTPLLSKFRYRYPAALSSKSSWTQLQRAWRSPIGWPPQLISSGLCPGWFRARKSYPRQRSLFAMEELRSSARHHVQAPRLRDSAYSARPPCHVVALRIQRCGTMVCAMTFIVGPWRSRSRSKATSCTRGAVGVSQRGGRAARPFSRRSLRGRLGRRLWFFVRPLTSRWVSFAVVMRRRSVRHLRAQALLLQRSS